MNYNLSTLKNLLFNRIFNRNTLELLTGKHFVSRSQRSYLLKFSFNIFYLRSFKLLMESCGSWSSAKVIKRVTPISTSFLSWNTVSGLAQPPYKTNLSK